MRAVNLLPRDSGHKAFAEGRNLPLLGGVCAGVLVAAVMGSQFMMQSGKLSSERQNLDALKAKVAALPPVPAGPTPAESQLAGEHSKRVTALSTALGSRVAWDRVFLRPQASKLKSVKADEAKAQQALTDYRQRLAATRSVPRIDVADVYRLATAMPGNVDMPDVILQLSQLARDTGIRFDSITPQAATAVGSYSAVPISVTFQGTFYELSDFLYRLRSLVSVHGGRLDATGRLFEVDTLNFGESELKFPNIQATLVIDAFVYGDSAA